MAKKSYVLIKLQSSESPAFLVKRKNSKSQKKLECKKYDPNVRKHVIYKETKMK